MVFKRDTRGITTVVGYALLISIIIVSSFAVFTVGYMTISESQSFAERGSAEQSMTMLNSKASLVAFEGSENQHVSIPTPQGSDVNIEETGRLKVDLIGMNKTDPTKTYVADTLYNESMGTLVYDKKGYDIAYQAGGVWAIRNSNVNTSTMVSPPEFTYTGDTATIPIVGFNKSQHVSGDEVVMQRGKQTSIFPTWENENLSNPVNPYQHVSVTVQSEYYQAWGRYFENDVGLPPNYDHENNSVTVYLVGERDKSETMTNAITSIGGEDRIQIKGSGAGSTFIDSYDSTVGPYSVSQTDNGTISAATGISAKGHVDFFGTVETEGDLILKGSSCVHGDAIVDGSVIGGGGGGGSCPITGETTTGADVPTAAIADNVIAQLVSELTASNNNDDTSAITDATPGELHTSTNPELTAGSYYIDELDIGSGETLTLNISDGDVKLLVDGEINVEGTISVTGNTGNDNRAQIYTRSSTITFDGATAETNNQIAKSLWLYGPAGTDILLDKHTSVTGVIYAAGTPSSPGTVTLHTHSELYGSVVGGTTKVQAQSKVHQDLALADEPVFTGDVSTNTFWAQVQYFHISHTELNVSSNN